MNDFVRVLRRDSAGREVLWQCSDCGKPFELGWGSRCNKCILEERRHQEILKAVSGHSVVIPFRETGQDTE